MQTITKTNSERGQVTSLAWRLCLPLLLLLAFGLRVYHLDWQSLWYDEAQTLLRALTPLDRLAAATPVEHSPTFFALEHFWLAIAGNNDFALRYLSAFASVTAVALVYRLGAVLGSRRSGTVAAVLLATGMFQVWYAQEARMYACMLATSLLATLLLWRLLTLRAKGTRPYVLPFIGYVLAVAATIYLHHYGLLLPLAHAVFALIWLASTRDWRGFARWCAAGACVLLLYLPGAARVLGMLGYSGWQQKAAAPGQLPWYFLTAYTAGDAMPDPWRAWLPWVYVALLLLGLYAWWRRDRLAGMLLACTTFVPVCGAWLLALTQPQFHERYTMMVTGPLMLLAGGGAVLVGELVGRLARQPAFARTHDSKRSRSAVATLVTAAILVALVAANGLALQRLYEDPGQQKAGYKQAAEAIAVAGRPGDVILSDVPAAENILARYYRGDLALRDLPFPGPKDEVQAGDLAGKATTGARRAWVVEGSGRPGSTKAWLAKNGWLASDEEFNGLHVSLYGLRELPRLRLPAALEFGSRLKLSGLELAGGTVDGDNIVFRARDLLGLTTLWETTGPLPSLRFSVRLRDTNGRVWQSDDYVPQAGYAPTPSWQPGTPISDRHGMVLAPDLPPGKYQVALRIYDSETAIPELAGGQEEAVLAQILVQPAELPPSPGELSMDTQRRMPLTRDLEVLGYSASQPLEVQGKNVLRVWWRAKERLIQPYRLQITLTTGSDGTASQTVQPLSAGLLDWWQANEIVGERYDLRLDPAMASGEYGLRLALLAPDGSVAGQAAIGTLPVRARSRVYQVPELQHPVQARFGEAIALRGYSVDRSSRASRQLKLTLYWQALARVPGRYKVFIHVLNEAGQTVAQADDFPAAGEAPTESWLPNEVVADTHTIDLPAGTGFRLLAGLYDPESGQRLEAWSEAGEQIPEGSVVLGELQTP